MYRTTRPRVSEREPLYEPVGFTLATLLLDGCPYPASGKVGQRDDGLKLVAGLLVHNVTLSESLLEHDAT